MIERILAWFQGLPAWGTGLLMLLLAAIVVGGGIAGYRTYDYVQHDNEFCLSCHLMEEPYQRFAQSAHRGLGCKACHQPTFAVRSQMALTQIIESPDTLAVHAEVPNERCAACHIEGDPEQWELVKNSAGHRIHFESDDPSLQGLRCVQCHSSGVHEFAPVDRTCGQSGCHTDTPIQLGGMSDLTIHCIACHDFSRPVDPSLPVSALTAAVTPDAEECLSCHVMRTLVDMPPDEPHDRACGRCHNPHEQTT
ncbi:MAG TPA: NapC/NirT family cytochrome c, partial [Longimicrobiales bacterium]|nr:NapC/NirT family cytochrome c [Longimicrobiales bacterium]